MKKMTSVQNILNMAMGNIEFLIVKDIKKSVISIHDDSGFSRLVFSSNHGLETGETIYLEFSGVYENKVYEVLKVVSNTEILIELDFISTDTAFAVQSPVAGKGRYKNITSFLGLKALNGNQAKVTGETFGNYDNLPETTILAGDTEWGNFKNFRVTEGVVKAYIQGC